MITTFQALILGAVQGATELFPISSLGHSVILPQILGWKIDQSADSFLIFLVATHLATSLVLLVFYFKDWVRIVKGISRSLAARQLDENDVYAKLGWLIVVGSIPAGILGLLFEKTVQTFLAIPMFAAAFLVVNGFMLWSMESLKKSRTSKVSAANQPRLLLSSIDPGIIDSSAVEPTDARISRLKWAQSVKIGFAQSLALIPGISRTGATMDGGLLAGLGHEDAARFSFLLATPIIFAAAVLKLSELIVPGASVQIGPLLVGVLAAALAAYLSVRFLSRYFKTQNLRPFAIYCVAAGILSLVILNFR